MTANVPTSPALEWRPRHSPWLIAVVVTMATFMEVLDTSIANVALPHIAGNLSASVDEATWVLTSYLVANAVVLPLSAFFSTLIGRKRFYMLCVALFTISSALCGMAQNLTQLVFFRILQGAAGGGLQPSEQAILVDTFPRHKLHQGMAVYGVAVVVAPILGPTLGGWITDNYSWHWIFFINVPVGLLSLLFTSQLVEDPPYMRRQTLKQGLRIDYIGLGLLAVGLGFLQIVLDKGEREDWFESNFIIICAVVSGLALLVAVIWELRSRDPIVDIGMLRDRNFAAATFLMFMVGFVLYGSTVLLPLFTQTLMGYTATWSGLVLSPGGFATMACMPLVGFLLGRFPAKYVLTIGLIIVGTSLLHMSTFTLMMGFTTLMLARVWQAVGLAFLFLPINTVAYQTISREKNNSAAGLVNLARNLGGSVGIALVTTMIARRSQYHQTMLASHTTPFNDQFRQMQQQATDMFVSLGSSLYEATNRANALLAQMMSRQAAAMSYIDCFWLLGVMFLAMIPMIALLKRNRPGKGPGAAH